MVGCFRVEGRWTPESSRADVRLPVWSGASSGFWKPLRRDGTGRQSPRVGWSRSSKSVALFLPADEGSPSGDCVSRLPKQNQQPQTHPFHERRQNSSFRFALRALRCLAFLQPGGM